MAEAEASPRNVEAVAARVRGFRDANEVLDVAERPSGDDSDARVRVLGERGEQPTRFPGQARLLGALDDGREGAVEIGEKDQRAPADQALLDGAVERHEPVTSP
jgi:hypothetical protein